MKIIKIIGVAFAICSAILLNSCDLLNGLFSDESAEKEWNIDTDGNVFLIQHNISDNYFIRNTGLASVKSTTSARNAVNDDSFIKSFTTKSDGLQKFNDTTKIYELEQHFLNEAAKNNSRTANNESIINQQPKDDTFEKGDEHSFYLIYEDKNKNEYYQEEPAVCMYKGIYCNVWFIDNDKTTNKKEFEYKDFEEIGNKFDSIYKIETEIIGTSEYTEYNANIYRQSNKKLQIVLADLYGDATENQDSGTYGYATLIDLYTNDYAKKIKTSENSLETCRSNELDVIYIDSHLYGYDGTRDIVGSDGKPHKYNCIGQIYSTIPHEYNHFINYVQKYIKYGNKSMPTWYTEMLSMTIEDMLWEKLGINEEDSSRGRIPMFDFFYNYGFTSWGAGNVLFSYANAFAYGAYLARNYGGEKLISTIAKNQYVGVQSIDSALQTLGYNMTFEKSTQEFVKVLFNTNYIESESDNTITLNRDGKTENNEFSLKAINLNFKNTYIDDQGKKVEQELGPQYIYKDKGTLKWSGSWEPYVQELYIYPKSFIVTYVGSNISSFVTKQPTQDILDISDFETAIVY